MKTKMMIARRIARRVRATRMLGRRVGQLDAGMDGTVRTGIQDINQSIAFSNGWDVHPASRFH
jgi:hypothetical protein